MIPRLSWRPILLFLLLAGAAVRIALASDRAFFGDENGTMIYLCRAPKYLLTHFREDPREPWLTMNVYILLEKAIAAVVGEGLLAMRLLSVCGGVGAIGVAAAVTRRLRPGSAALVAAALVAANPYLIRYAAIARSYSLFVLAALLVWLLFLRWRERPDRRRAIALSLASLGVGLTHLNGLFVVAWLGIVLAVEVALALRGGGGKHRAAVVLQGLRRLAPPFLLASLLLGAFYLQLLDDLVRSRSDFGAGAFTPVDYVPEVFTSYLASEWIAWPVLFLMGFGALALARTHRMGLVQVVLWLVVPVAAASALGYSHYPKAFARFHIFTLPGILILAAIGLDASLRRLRRPFRHVAGAGVALAAALLWVPAVAAEFSEARRLPYHEAWRYIAERIAPGDRIVGLTGWTQLHLRSYLACEERRTRERKASSVEEMLREPVSGRVFLVSSTSHAPDFGVETARFGSLRVFTLPPEDEERRLERLERGLEEAIEAIPRKHLCEECYHLHNPYAAIARLRGRDRVALHHKSIARRSRGLQLETKNTDRGGEDLEY